MRVAQRVSENINFYDDKRLSYGSANQFATLPSFNQKFEMAHGAFYYL
jgi:hypothetical protein